MDVSSYKIRPSKHFVLGWMRKWGYDIEMLRNILESSEIQKVGKHKYEAYFKQKGGRKIIFVIDEEYKEIFIITGAEGR